MIISHKHRFAYFSPVGNCGTTTITKALLIHHDDNDVCQDYEFNFSHPKNVRRENYALVNKHIRPHDFAIAFPKKWEEIKDYDLISSCRDPFDVFASFLFKNYTRGPVTITSNLVLHACSLKEYDLTRFGQVGSLEVKNIMPFRMAFKFESLSDNLHDFLKSIDDYETQVTHEEKHSFSKSSYRDFYDKSGEEAIREIFKKDFSLGY